VRFTGFINDDAKWRLLRNADVFVMPSRVDPSVQHEGFGLAFIEAAAFGVPGIGSTGGGIPEAIIHGETGLLVPEDSVERLAAALIFLYRNPDKREAMATRATERARSEFSSITIAAHFDDEVRKRVVVK
jgi:glycosyltransferase involved in cell wall biosynthesis